MGWYCRIMPDPNWPPQQLIGDLNFGHCNTTSAFDDAGYDRDGHCHGSSDDSTYYWWMRDHWHRGYNGRLRCCCGWYEGGDTPLLSGRIANRCDYRRLVTQVENLNDCRDANEDHGLGYDDIGCNRAYESQINNVIPETDDFCWELTKFGYSEGDNDEDEDEDNDEDEDEDNDEDEDEDNDEDEDEDNDEDCEEDRATKFLYKYNKKKDKKIMKTCGWLQNKKKKKQSGICKKIDAAREECPVTCKAC